MSEMRVRDGTTWKTPKEVRAKYGTGWSKAKEIYVCERNPDPNNPGQYIHTWTLVGGSYVWEAPTTSPQNVTLDRGPELDGPSQHDCSWTPPGSKPESTYNVRVEWFKNDGVVFTDVVPSTQGSVKRTFDVFDNIHCEVAYSNSAGTGPEVRAPSSGYV